MDLVIISSAINTCNNPLSYYPVRSIYSPRERFYQTLRSIDSLSKIPDKKILFVETTLIPDYEEEIKSKVDFYRNIYRGNENIIDGPDKGIGEAISIMFGTAGIDITEYDNIFKLSGRYYLNDNFNLSLWQNDDTIFWVNKVNGDFLTVFYKINRKHYYQWMEALYYLYETHYVLSIETLLASKMADYKQIETVGVEGLTHGGTFVQF